MSRMLEALKALENRRSSEQSLAEPTRHNVGSLKPQIARPQPSEAPPMVATVDTPAVEVDSPAALVEPERASRESCHLGFSAELPDCYFDTAVRISEQIASNYCNVLLFVTPDQAVEQTLSMPDLARAFALQSSGGILLIDGDLRYGRLSKSAGVTGAGMVEVMLGSAQWPQAIHPTEMSRIDFVPAGHSQVPSFDRPEFGWSALRPQYRVVLIGLSVASELEIGWLSARCDGAYLVISRPHTRRQAAAAAINTLRSAGANVSGSIVIDD